MANVMTKLTQLKKRIQSERMVFVGEKIELNNIKIQAYASDLQSLAASRYECSTVASGSGNFLSLRMNYPLCKVSGLIQGSSDRENLDNEEVVFSTTAKLPHVERIPPYTTWIFLDRNQRMADDQSVVGRRRIYYDQHGSEALVCSDSEEELAQAEGEKHEFSAGEDRVLRLAFQEYGLGNEVLSALTQFVGGTTLEIQDRCNLLTARDQQMEKQHLKNSGEERNGNNVILDKSLSAALDSFDNLFCRRCLIFDCRLHGCSKTLIYPNEKQAILFDSEEDRKPCGDQCYLQSNSLAKISTADPIDTCKGSDEESKSLLTIEEGTHQSEGSNIIPEPANSSAEASEVAPDDDPSSKKLKLTDSKPSDHSTASVTCTPELDGCHEYELEGSALGSVPTSQKNNLDASDSPHGAIDNKTRDSLHDIKGKDVSELPLKRAYYSFGSSAKASRGWENWKPFEKDLYLKGLEIFGRNSCFIAKNLLPGLKTCKEVSSYMYGDEAGISRGSSAKLSSFFEDAGKADMDHMDADMPVKSRICRKRGRVRKVKSSWKSAGHPSLWRRIAEGKDLPYKQYTPCGCQSLCGKQCPCLQNGTCCEKYCGCSKACKNRFRGCHCAKSQCKSRQCPCFAAGRECDPDVCRNCWVSCGDGSFGEPPRRGDSQCGNMKLLLRQQQRIILAKSEIAGWGAFLKKGVNKNDYLGEYTGELISHQEADKRGKIYDRANSSFLFDLNDKYVVDAYRKGDKLKFANHSSTPNCYAKVMLVAGDHRVGIYANEQIEAGEELFYDYRYGPDLAPAWARRPETSRRDDSPVPHGRAKKHQSG
ncbi:histone-lysine N-methyltransferase EZA1 isoform X2 [Andrographis paniculata]|nr:histone-lysine N-methyltransferase EZA1 isoform X2 [Andrographis paniculata]